MMRKFIMRFLGIFLAIIMIFGASPFSNFSGTGFYIPDRLRFGTFNLKANAAAYTGKCGDNINWSLNTGGGTLVLTGSGAMWNYDNINTPPWYGYKTIITDISIQNSITTIGSYAFYNCGNVHTSETIPGNVTTIGNYAFYACALTSITFPSSLTSIGDHAFDSCVLLDTLLIRSEVGYLGEYAFANCTGITSLEIQAGVLRKIGNYAFYNCYGLEYLDIPNNITAIGASAFELCYQLSDIHFPDTLKTIGPSSFYECEDLTSVTIPDSVTFIGEAAFSQCDSLASIYYSGELKTLGRDAFRNTAWYNAKSDGIVEFGNMAYKYKGTMPNTALTLHVSIADGAFEGCRGLTGVTLAPEVKDIGSRAFRDCSRLASVSISDRVTIIRSEAFAGCGSLSSLSIGEGVSLIDSRAFYGCYMLADLTIPDGVTIIENEAFAGCLSLLNLTVGSGTEYIAPDAFALCESLDTINFNAQDCFLDYDTLSGPYSNTFSACEKITTVSIGGTCKKIPDNFFMGHGEVNDWEGPDVPFTSLTIANGVESIGTNAFSGCEGLTSVVIPGSVENIGNNAFYNCEGLLYIQMINGVKNIGTGSFSGCSLLTTVTIPGSVENIGNKAFYDCGLETVYIGSGVTSIGSKAFSSPQLSQLTGAYFTGDAPAASTGVFGEVGAHFRVYYIESAEGFTNPWYGYTTEIYTGVKIAAAEGSATLIDPENNYIFGLATGLTKEIFEDDYISLIGNVHLTYSALDENIGTGVIVELVDNSTNEILMLYTLIIYGDSNGDGSIDSIDAGIIVDYENYIITFDPTQDAILNEAADLNGDGCVDSVDAGLVVDTENYLVSVSQTTGLATKI